MSKLDEFEGVHVLGMTARFSNTAVDLVRRLATAVASGAVAPGAGLSIANSLITHMVYQHGLLNLGVGIANDDPSPQDNSVQSGNANDFGVNMNFQGGGANPETPGNDLPGGLLDLQGPAQNAAGTFTFGGSKPVSYDSSGGTNRDDSGFMNVLRGLVKQDDKGQPFSGETDQWGRLPNDPDYGKPAGIQSPVIYGPQSDSLGRPPSDPNFGKPELTQAEQAAREAWREFMSDTSTHSAPGDYNVPPPPGPGGPDTGTAYDPEGNYNRGPAIPGLRITGTGPASDIDPARDYDNTGRRLPNGIRSPINPALMPTVDGGGPIGPASSVWMPTPDGGGPLGPASRNYMPTPDGGGPVGPASRAQAVLQITQLANALSRLRG